MTSRTKKNKNLTNANPSPNDPIHIPNLRFDPDSNHKKVYDMLKHRKINPTKFYHGPTLEALGIRQDVLACLTDLGWNRFSSMHALTYERVTLEFLASLERTLNGEEEFDISFQLFNTKFRMTLAELNGVFGWPSEARIYHPHLQNFPNYNQEAFWRLISRLSNFQSRSVSSTAIVSSILRYTHRLLVGCVFTKQELSKMTKEDLIVLYMATETPDRLGGMLNSGFHFLERCVEIKKGELYKGDINIGGMISLIAINKGFGEHLKQLKAIDTNPFLDLDALRRMQWIRPTHDPERWSWFVKGHHHCFLPNPEATRIDREARNVWDVASEPENEDPPPRAEHVVPPPHGCSTSQPSSSSSSFDLEHAITSLSLTQNRMLSMMEGMRSDYDGMMVQTNQIYNYHVERGDFAPYMNYPHWPPQHGPVPGWQNNQPTYPYHPHRDPPYDYREPGGTNPVGDPNYPFVPPPDNGGGSSSSGLPPPPYYGYPPGYSGGWDPHPMPPYGNYGDPRPRMD